MASIWMRLDAVPVDNFVSKVVVPMIRALGDHGIHANLKAVTDRVFRNEGNLILALFPGGKLSFYYTTGPTDDIDFRSMMASIEGIPNGLGLGEDDVTAAIQQFESGLIEDGIYVGRTQVTKGGSFSGIMEVAEVTNLGGSVAPQNTGTNTDEVDAAILQSETSRADEPAITDERPPAPTNGAEELTASDDPGDIATATAGFSPANEPGTAEERSFTPAFGSLETAASGDSGETSTTTESYPDVEPAAIGEHSFSSTSDAAETAESDDSEEKAKTKAGCYIATAIYGGYDAPQVRVLRRFRDDRLATTSAGRYAIRLYYKMSPILADHLAQQSWLQKLTRPIVDAIVSDLRFRGISDSAYRDPEYN